MDYKTSWKSNNTLNLLSNYSREFVIKTKVVYKNLQRFQK